MFEVGFFYCCYMKVDWIGARALGDNTPEDLFGIMRSLFFFLFLFSSDWKTTAIFNIQSMNYTHILHAAPDMCRWKAMFPFSMQMSPSAY